MRDRIATLRKRLFDARADVDASNRELRQASARKLAELLASTDKTALLHGLKDPALTQYDRDRLEQKIEELLPSRRVRIPRTITDTLRFGLRHARYHWRGLALLIIMSIPVITVGGMAERNTGQMKIRFNTKIPFVWLFPDGHSEAIPISIGTVFVLMGREANGDARLRIWSSDYGYGAATMTAEAFDQYAQF
ncbi:MAG: hypothetical protein HYX37_14695 [Rhizobiales bacterium]|nr:hypothetical protein [Hyphomicrobiales bacterium]